MKFFKFIEDNYILGIGKTPESSSIGVEITFPEYNSLEMILNSEPTKLGYEFKLNEDGTWEKVEKDKSEMTESELKEIYAQDILNSVTIDTSAKDSEEVQTTMKYNPETHVIEYQDNGYRYGEGTATNPKQYVQGDSVEEGIYYCLYKYSSKTGTYYAQTTSGTYKAIATCTPTSFGVATAFEQVW